MKSPFTGKEMLVGKERRTMTFRKEPFEIVFHFYRCMDTGEQFEDELFAKLNYNQVINQYRSKHSIPFTEEIISIRNKYDINASKMSEILGFGANSYRQYEAGEIPSLSNARLIQLASDPHEFIKLIELCNSLDKTTKEKLNRKIHLLLDKPESKKMEQQLENFFFNESFPTKYTGYRKPGLSRLAEMVVFFTQQLQPFKTKLNKLLFYSDFTYFKKTGFSISGAKYRAIPLGPVPDAFNSIFEYLSKNEVIEIDYVAFADGNIGEQFKPTAEKTFNGQLFSDDEISVLEQISKRFKNVSSKEIIEFSHKEKAWIENKDQKQLIDYSYSFDLN